MFVSAIGSTTRQRLGGIAITTYHAAAAASGRQAAQRREGLARGYLGALAERPGTTTRAAPRADLVITAGTALTARAFAALSAAMPQAWELGGWG